MTPELYTSFAVSPPPPVSGQTLLLLADCLPAAAEVGFLLQWVFADVTLGHVFATSTTRSLSLHGDTCDP